MEEDLRRALVVVVVGSRPPFSEEAIVAEVCKAHDLEPSSLELLRAGVEVYLLVLPDEATTTLVFNDGRPIIAESFRLFFRRWTRFTASTGAVPLHLVDVSISGIPPHAWELATAKQLLDEGCWIREVHQETASRRDCFRLTTWCCDPGLIPPAMDLCIVEPPVDMEETPPVRQALQYPVEIKVAPLSQPSTEEGTDASAGVGAGEGGRPAKKTAAQPAASRNGSRCMCAWARCQVDTWTKAKHQTRPPKHRHANRRMAPR
ncbi:hypothetical protein E2562_038349 [Oryza meyeriana var. granulata]|uniref:DUF4283 domain-containing protein n=1 Tax=Oryza meyeriana var. granulata TaxID=110450 RepID=A0A6G1FGX7_9ORYZ|nr:hypothetical protein E2562_038349 [Oryza meyeriana var. granulata]